MEQRPLIAITMGDPAGVGPEIIVKSSAAGALAAACRPVVVGDAAVLQKAAAGLGLALAVRSIGRLADAEPGPGRLDVLDLRNVDVAKHAWGEPRAASGKAVVEYIKSATYLALNKEAQAVVTAPISKEMMNAAGFRYAGHTELFADLTNTRDFGMLFVGGGLRVMLVTIHVALRDVPKLITRKNVLKAIRLAHAALVRQFGIPAPRIGIAGLNPHAGEARLFGSEEADEILPAVAQARAEGIDASDPLPADTLFFKARNGRYDLVVAMYHDQGLAPLKALAFGASVNVTVGLPIIRTSVDHGTAFDIAGKGIADPTSLVEAVKLAAAMAAVSRTAGGDRS